MLFFSTAIQILLQNWKMENWKERSWMQARITHKKDFSKMESINAYAAVNQFILKVAQDSLPALPLLCWNRLIWLPPWKFQYGGHLSPGEQTPRYNWKTSHMGKPIVGWSCTGASNQKLLCHMKQDRGTCVLNTGQLRSAEYRSLDLQKLNLGCHLHPDRKWTSLTTTAVTDGRASAPQAKGPRANSIPSHSEIRLGKIHDEGWEKQFQIPISSWPLLS